MALADTVVGPLFKWLKALARNAFRGLWPVEIGAVLALALGVPFGAMLYENGNPIPRLKRLYAGTPVVVLGTPQFLGERSPRGGAPSFRHVWLSAANTADRQLIKTLFVRIRTPFNQSIKQATLVSRIGNAIWEKAEARRVPSNDGGGMLNVHPSTDQITIVVGGRDLALMAQERILIGLRAQAPIEINSNLLFESAWCEPECEVIYNGLIPGSSPWWIAIATRVLWAVAWIVIVMAFCTTIRLGRMRTGLPGVVVLR